MQQLLESERANWQPETSPAAHARWVRERTIYDVIHSTELVAHRFGRGRGGIRVADRDRVNWEQRCRELADNTAQRTPLAPIDPTDLVKKHFDL